MVAALTCFFFSMHASAQLAPGPLSKAHSFLNGAANCTSCHRLGGQATKCLECHTEIAARIAAGRGMHARVAGKTAGSQSCSTCHSEHNGERFELIRWEPPRPQFDHGKTGWPLSGKHATLTCSRCHAPEKIVASEKPQIRVKDLSRTFLGLPRECAGCHNDQHRGQFGRTCEQCHTTSDWKTVPNFDHGRTHFTLTGAHARVSCDKCHTPAERGGPPRWTGLQFDRCTGCHTDPHRGKFATTCQSCHSTAGWRSVSMQAVAARFDHATTKFPLLGKHGSLRCDQCHAAGDFKKPIAFQKCSDCHHPDPHSGQFAKRADAGECSACHTVGGFKPAKFGLPEHAQTEFSLEGKHAAVGCERCHIPAGKATLYRIKFAQCADCHKDAHDRQFAAAPYLNRCQNCHTVQGFRPSTFSVARHSTSPFPLTGSHVAVKCSDCHKPMSGTDLKNVARYRFEDRSCTACHQDPHLGQFRRLVTQARGDGSTMGCQTCHSPEAWKDMRFPHAVDGFPLVGKHATTACANCHKPAQPDIPLKLADFQSAPSKCERCHQDYHLGQFARADGITSCAGCHSSARWVPSLFDHGRETRFPLLGKHRDVKCAACHKNVKMVEGKTVTEFKRTPTECVACHRNPV